MPKIRMIAKGDRITAPYLNSITAKVEKLDEAITPPSELPKDSPAPTREGDETWTEIERTTTTERVTDPNDENVYVDVDRFVTVTFEKSGGKLVTLRFVTPIL